MSDGAATNPPSKRQNVPRCGEHLQGRQWVSFQVPPDPAAPGAADRQHLNMGGGRFADANGRPLRTARSGGTGYGAAWYGAANRRHGSGGWSDVCLCRHGMMPPVGGMRRRPDRAGGTVPGNCPARSMVPPIGGTEHGAARLGGTRPLGKGQAQNRRRPCCPPGLHGGAARCGACCGRHGVVPG